MAKKNGVTLGSLKLTSWWFQPIWKILVKLDHFPKYRLKIKNECWNHHPAKQTVKAWKNGDKLRGKKRRKKTTQFGPQLFTTLERPKDVMRCQGCHLDFFRPQKMLSKRRVWGFQWGEDCLGKVISPSKIGGPNIQTQQKNISSTKKTINAKNWRPSKKKQIVEPTASKPFLWPPPFLPHEVGELLRLQYLTWPIFYPSKSDGRRLTANETIRELKWAVIKIRAWLSIDSWLLNRDPYLVGGFNPSEKY